MSAQYVLETCGETHVMILCNIAMNELETSGRRIYPSCKSGDMMRKAMDGIGSRAVWPHPVKPIKKERIILLTRFPHELCSSFIYRHRLTGMCRYLASCGSSRPHWQVSSRFRGEWESLTAYSLLGRSGQDPAPLPLRASVLLWVKDETCGNCPPL